MFRSVLGAGGLIFLTALYSPAQTLNVWTNHGSGNWEDLRWSLGQPPAPGEAIMLTNSGWKAIAISAGTAQNYPQTLNPYSITLGAYTDSFNVLLLNYAGYATPLTVSSLVMNSNSSVTALSSALTVNNSMGTPFSVGGVFNHGDFSVVSAANLNIGDVGPGAYNLTNGTLLVTSSQSVGGAFPGRFNQFGGTNYPGTFELKPSGESDIFDGALITSNILSRGGSAFNQQGGLVKPNGLIMNSGQYTLSSGVFTSSSVQVPGSMSQFDNVGGASFVQYGGTNNSGWLSLGNWRPPFINGYPAGNYTLTNGVLNAGSISIGPYGNFFQSGGSNFAGGLGLNGDIVYYYSPAAGSYNLSGGFLSSPGIRMCIANFSQTGGTNQISGSLIFSNYVTMGSATDYHLSGGLLTTSNTIVGASQNGGFFQTGGTHVVSNLFNLTQAAPYFTGYMLSGGQLITRDIQVDTGATFLHAGGTLINTGSVILADGNWVANTNNQQFGRLVLGQGSNSVISLPAAASILRFAASSSVTWSNQAMLTIEHWNGSMSGGGLHQIYVGAGSSGLAAQQLTQIQFHNPLGQNGNFPASILATGEIVPAQLLTSRAAAGTLELSWGPGETLQSATNLNGPYQDVPEASSPYHVLTTEPQRFFRLRK